MAGRIRAGSICRAAVEAGGKDNRAVNEMQMNQEPATERAAGEVQPSENSRQSGGKKKPPKRTVVLVICALLCVAAVTGAVLSGTDRSVPGGEEPRTEATVQTTEESGGPGQEDLRTDEPLPDADAALTADIPEGDAESVETDDADPAEQTETAEEDPSDGSGATNEAGAATPTEITPEQTLADFRQETQKLYDTLQRVFDKRDAQQQSR